MRVATKTLERMAFAGKGTVSCDMALDLLEARELIEKQKEFIDNILKFTTSIISGSDDYTFSKVAAREELANLVKEYAE